MKVGASNTLCTLPRISRHHDHIDSPSTSNVTSKFVIVPVWEG